MHLTRISDRYVRLKEAMIDFGNLDIFQDWCDLTPINSYPVASYIGCHPYSLSGGG